MYATKASKNPGGESKLSPTGIFLCLLPASLRESGPRRFSALRTPSRYLLLLCSRCVISLPQFVCAAYCVIAYSVVSSISRVIVLRQPPKQQEDGATIRRAGACLPPDVMVSHTKRVTAKVLPFSFCLIGGNPEGFRRGKRQDGERRSITGAKRQGMRC